MKTKKIFISYSWKNKAVVDQIDDKFKAIGLPLTRDVRDVGTYESIKNFMKRIKSSDFVILVISDDYMKSKNCMYEIIELVKNDTYEDIIFPILVKSEGFNLYDDKSVPKYIKYWTKKYDELENESNGLRPGENVETFENLRIIDSIKSTIGPFIKAINDINAPSLDELIDTNFKAILDKIGYSESEKIQQLFAIEKIEDKEQQDIEIDSFVFENPKFYIGYIFRAYMWGKRLKHQKAIADYTKAIELDPEYADVYISRGIAYNMLGKYEKAIEDYTKAIALDPESAFAYNSRGCAYNMLKEYEKAKEDFTKAIALDPELTIIYNSREIDYHDLEEYEKAITFDPKLAFAYNSRGIAYRKLKEHQKAIADYTKAIALDQGDAFAYYDRGNAYHELGKYKKAIADYTKAIALDPEYAFVCSRRGDAYYKLKEYEKAIADFTRAIELEPEHAATYYNRGNVYDKLGEDQKAKADFKKYKELR